MTRSCDALVGLSLELPQIGEPELAVRLHGEEEFHHVAVLELLGDPHGDDLSIESRFFYDNPPTFFPGPGTSAAPEAFGNLQDPC